MNVTPKNDFSLMKKKRKAATFSRKKTMKMIKDSTKDDLTDIEMEESDIEESWKPTETVNERESAKEQNSVNDEQNGFSRKKSSMQRAPSPEKGLVTSTRLDDEPLFRGDFVALKSQIKLENFSIWRYDCMGTMQRYDRQPNNSDENIFVSANVFSEYYPHQREKYQSVAAQYVELDEIGGKYIVKLLC